MMFVSDYYLTAKLFNAGNSTRSSTHKMRYQYFFEDLLWSRTCSFGMGQFVWTLMSTSEYTSREMFCVHESEITAGVPSIPWLLPFKFWESWLSFWYLCILESWCGMSCAVTWSVHQSHHNDIHFTFQTPEPIWLSWQMFWLSWHEFAHTHTIFYHRFRFGFFLPFDSYRVKFKLDARLCNASIDCICNNIVLFP